MLWQLFDNAQVYLFFIMGWCTAYYAICTDRIIGNVPVCTADESKKTKTFDIMKYFSQLFLTVFFSIVCITLQAQLFEDFEEGEKDSYESFAIELASGEWMFDDAVIGSHASDNSNGQQSARIRDGFIAMEFDYPNGMSEVSFYAANFGSDTGGAVQLSYSADGGESWTPIGEPVSLGDDLEQYAIQENVEGDVRLRFEKVSGVRINIDDVLISDYIETTQEPSLLLRINEIPYPNQSTFDFGLNTGTVSAALQIRNTGLEELVVSSNHISGDEFTVEGDLNVSLAHMETAHFTLHYESDTPGFKEELLSLVTNDPENQFYTLGLIAQTLDTSGPVAIADARQLPQSSEVTVAGWVTVADQFAGPVYFQDETAGIAWYNGDLMAEEYLVGAAIGDSIVVTGEVGNFNNLLQIVNDTEFEVFPDANREIEPEEITIAQMNGGDFEGLLVRIENVEFEETGVFAGATNYNIMDDTDEGELRIDNHTNIPGTVIPNSPVEVTGVAGRFYHTHQILPRFNEDIEILVGPIILSAPPYEVSATSQSITFEWETRHEGHSEVRYGTTPDMELGYEMDENHKTHHQITLTGLEPATTYKVQLRSAFDADTSATNLYISSTGSPAGTTGEIHAFFNKDVEQELATFREADENVDFSQKLIEYIQMAEHTAEFAFYNISGSVGGTIADELMAAHDRGVDVRVIVSGHTGSENAIVSQLSQAGVKAVQSIGNAQMHNKFAVIDAHHSDPARTFVITSSWNATDQGTYNQFQNMVVVQDVAVARAYWREFNQMWGADAGEFNSHQARFSYEKSIVNPTVFWVGEDETQIEVYFSPQANAEAQIIRTLLSAEESIHLALNLITRPTLVNSMLSRFEEGVAVHGVIGSIGEQGSQFGSLETWADVHHFSQAQFGLLHHKYAIIDGLDGSFDSKVITGSHNWSSNANFVNDENNMIIHNSRVANEYFQEFAARYWQAGGTEEFEVTTSAEEQGTTLEQQGPELYTFPNPFRHSTNIGFSLDVAQQISIRVYDITGRLVATPAAEQFWEDGTHTVQWDASNMESGVYFCRLYLERGQVVSQKMMVME